MAGPFRELRRIVETAGSAAVRDGFAEGAPTPLRSDFWGTSLAPSSSEVLFREMEKRRPTEAAPLRVFTVQPCVRFADMAPFSDGIHLIHFHMFTCFASPVQDPERDVRWFLDLVESLGVPVPESSFTYFPGASPLVPQPMFPEFGLPLLERLGVDPSRRTACAGTANYQVDLHRAETGNQRAAWGPRIEILADAGAPVEYGTLIYGSARSDADSAPFPPTLSMVFGVERVAQIAAGASSVWDLPSFRGLQDAVLRTFFPNQPTFPLIPDVRHALELVLALHSIAVAEPELRPGDRGVRHQLRRIVRAASRSLAHVGLEAAVVLAELKRCGGPATLPPSPPAVCRLHEWLDPSGGAGRQIAS